MSGLEIYRNKRVLVTGHTGFKGAWLTEWLLDLGAHVSGASLPPCTEPNLSQQLELEKRVDHHILDIRDAKAVAALINKVQPHFVFHLAAQPLVRLSYQTPVATYETNVLGTLHVLEALRTLESPCAAVMITTDKCYENKNWPHGYRENDPLGGHDPYSASKAAAEIVIASHRLSFFQNHPVQVASARAGNVIGGGDWALDRLVPDVIRALHRGESITIRNPTATRPWQHVLDPLSGYLWLGALLFKGDQPNLASAFNFGPGKESNRDVAALVEEILKHWPGQWENRSEAGALHEAQLLHLSTDKAHQLLQWSPVWDFSASIARTVEWYRKMLTEPSKAHSETLNQIRFYTQEARARQFVWALHTA